MVVVVVEVDDKVDVGVEVVIVAVEGEAVDAVVFVVLAVDDGV